MKRRVLVVPVLLVALALVVAACSGGTRKAAGKGGASSSPQPSYQSFLNCMRQHGVNLPDPDPDSPNVTIGPPPGSEAVWGPALQACQQYLPGGVNAATDPQQLEALRQYTLCMRAHGVELSDPDPNTGKSQLQGRFAGMNRDQINNDPTYKAAGAACAGVLQSAKPSEKGK
jgi:hypothetical protein